IGGWYFGFLKNFGKTRNEGPPFAGTVVNQIVPPTEPSATESKASPKTFPPIETPAPPPAAPVPAGSIPAAASGQTIVDTSPSGALEPSKAPTQLPILPAGPKRSEEHTSE